MASTPRGQCDGQPRPPLDTTASGNGRSGRRDGLQSNKEMGQEIRHQAATVTSPTLNSEEAQKLALELFETEALEIANKTVGLASFLASLL